MTSKKYLPTLFLLLAGLTTGWAQTVQATTPVANIEQFPQIMTTLFFALLAVLFVVILLVLLKANSFLTKQLISLQAEKNGVLLPDEAAASQALPVEEDFFTRLRKKYWENPVPREQEADIMFHHDYDGIRELDNHLPPWWVNLFVLCCLWALGYMWYYHWGGKGPNQTQEYQIEMETAKKEIAIALAGKANSVDESSVTALTDASSLGEGELIYKSVCAACHGQQGEGMVGPNFTDAYWIHGGGIKNMFKTIKYGVPEKGMISWSAQLKPADMQKVASYILTMQGTNPPNPKAPQGEIWKDDIVAQDSTTVNGGDKDL